MLVLSALEVRHEQASSAVVVLAQAVLSVSIAIAHDPPLIQAARCREGTCFIACTGSALPLKFEVIFDVDAGQEQAVFITRDDGEITHTSSTAITAEED